MKRFSENCQGVRLFLAVLWVVSLLGTAVANDTPQSLSGATLVDAAKAKAMIEGGAVIFDVRVANEYAEAHIKGAKSVPYKEKSAKAVDYNAAEDSFDIGQLPPDKNATVIFACNGAECWKSYKASVAAIKAGYKKVYWLRGGIPEWKAKGYAVE